MQRARLLAASCRDNASTLPAAAMHSVLRRPAGKTAHQLDNVLDDLTPGQDALRAPELLDRPRDLYRTAPDEGPQAAYSHTVRVR